jgi:nitrate reductase alpha subunit
MPHVVGGLEVYEQQTVWPVVAQNTDLLVFWGANPLNTNQICWGVADHGAYPGLEAYKKSGKKVIVIDPIRTETVRYFDAEWIAPRPQTDVALMLGIAHTLYSEKLHDEKFLKSYTAGFDKFLPYLTGQADGTPQQGLIRFSHGSHSCSDQHDDRHHRPGDVMGADDRYAWHRFALDHQRHRLRREREPGHAPAANRPGRGVAVSMSV